MKDDSVLYQIKTIDKLLLRNIFSGDDLMNKVHYTPTQMQIIKYILKNKGKDIYQKDLENILNLRRATVSGVLQTMEKNNLIERVVNDDDARTKKIILNQDTKRMFNKKEKMLNELENIIKQDIDEKDLETFLNVLSTMQNNIKKYENTGKDNNI